MMSSKNRPIHQPNHRYSRLASSLQPLQRLLSGQIKIGATPHLHHTNK
jgi:hypothetical protein